MSHNKQRVHFAPSGNADNGILRIVYAFAGHRRRADVHEHLQSLADEFGFTLEMHEFDLLRDEKQNLLDESFWDELKTLIRDIRPFCVIATPPCSTYSRARNHYSERPGPRPIRSREHPRGFPWLSPKDKTKADEGTLLAERTWELFNLASDVGACYLGEFPEDLGATKNGNPASIWQMQQFQDLLVLPGCRTFAIFQCEFGAETPKPTRFVSDLKFFEGNIFPGVPQYNLTRHGITRVPFLHIAHMVGTTHNSLESMSWANGRQLQRHTTREHSVYSLQKPLQRPGQTYPPLRRGHNLRMRSHRLSAKSCVVQTHSGIKHFQRSQIYMLVQFLIFQIHKRLVQAQKLLRLFQRLQNLTSFLNFHVHRVSARFQKVFQFQILWRKFQLN